MNTFQWLRRSMVNGCAPNLFRTIYSATFWWRFTESDKVLVLRYAVEANTFGDFSEYWTEQNKPFGELVRPAPMLDAPPVPIP